MNELVSRKERDAAIDEFDYSRYLHSHDSTKTVRELRRLFKLAGDGHQIDVCAPTVDAFWHRMILHTRSYSEFCESAFGTYLHHTPGQFCDDDGMTFAEFAQAYARRFGEPPPKNIWIELPLANK